MNRFSRIFTAATLAVGGLAFVGCDNTETSRNTTPSNTSTPADRDDTVADKTERAAERTADAVGTAAENTKEAARDAGGAIADATRKAGDKLGSATDDARVAAGRVGEGEQATAAAPDAEGIRDILASVTEAALTENGLDDLTERLVDADRNRIGDAIGQESAEHTALVKQFRADWKAKYGQDFDIKEDKAFPDSMFTVTQGEIGDAAPSRTEVATGQAGDVDANREAGRNIATVQVAESHGMPAVTVPLIHEAPDNWRIDAPDTIDAAKLRSNVLAHLKAAHDMKAEWPANVDDAYAAVTHHVLMAVLDKPLAK
jgi:hypothetical protein